MDVNIAFLGFGNVGRALARLLLDQTAALRKERGLSVRTTGIMTGRHGAAIDPAGIDLEQALAAASQDASFDQLSKAALPADSMAFIDACGADVLFESTPVHYENGQPAISYLRTALQCGMHAITANKGPVVHAYHELQQLAAQHGRRFLFESAVMDGAPVFSLWREALPGLRLNAFRGILNSTTNLILTHMETGASFDQAVSIAQEMGVAETDPSGDIEGYDAAVKVAALVTVLMDTPFSPFDVQRRGIEGLREEQVVEAAAHGERWKLVCSAQHTEGGVQARVQPERLPSHDPLYAVMGTSSAVTFETDLLGDLFLREDDPGPRTTAYGMFADMLNALRPAS